MIIVTGGAGFVGSNLVKGLNEMGRTDILIVDNLQRGEKCKNLNGIVFDEYIDKQDFLRRIQSLVPEFQAVEAVFHGGACSDTMEYNGRYMMENNYEYSKTLLHWCLEKKVPFVYASSASVYGSGHRGFRESDSCEEALNVYAFSKLMFDRYVRRILPTAKSQVVGLRYFNVFGPQEQHKGKMASIVYQFWHQLRREGVVRLYKGIDGYGDGEQARDFVSVKDVVHVNLHFFEQSGISGIFNCGTGQARTFNAVANALIKAAGSGHIEYIDFPESLVGKYQSYTQADVTKLEATGYAGGFTDLEAAVREYCRMLEDSEGFHVRP